MGFIEYNGRIEVHKSLLNVILHDQPSQLHGMSEWSSTESARDDLEAMKEESA
jgi:CRP/FNR family transcriptional regulator, cyclic AMP receptor protein